MGVIANISNFFENDLLFWWFPKERVTYNDGKKRKIYLIILKKIYIYVYRFLIQNLKIYFLFTFYRYNLSMQSSN